MKIKKENEITYYFDVLGYRYTAAEVSEFKFRIGEVTWYNNTFPTILGNFPCTFDHMTSSELVDDQLSEKFFESALESNTNQLIADMVKKLESHPDFPNLYFCALGTSSKFEGNELKTIILSGPKSLDPLLKDASNLFRSVYNTHLVPKFRTLCEVTAKVIEQRETLRKSKLDDYSQKFEDYLIETRSDESYHEDLENDIQIAKED